MVSSDAPCRTFSWSIRANRAEMSDDSELAILVKAHPRRMSQQAANLWTNHLRSFVFHWSLILIKRQKVLGIDASTDCSSGIRNYWGRKGLKCPGSRTTYSTLKWIEVGKGTYSNPNFGVPPHTLAMEKWHSVCIIPFPKTASMIMFVSRKETRYTTAPITKVATKSSFEESIKFDTFQRSWSKCADKVLREIANRPDKESKRQLPLE